MPWRSRRHHAVNPTATDSFRKGGVLAVGTVGQLTSRSCIDTEQLKAMLESDFAVESIDFTGRQFHPNRSIDLNANGRN